MRNLAAGAVDVARRVDGAAVLVDLVMDMGTSGAPGGAYQGDGLPLAHQVPGGNQVPLVVRLEGTNAEKAREMLATSGLKVIAAADLTDAAQKVVAAAR